MKDKDLKYWKTAIGRNIRENYKPQPEWEDKHPFLATMIILGVMLFNPVSLLIIGFIGVCITLMVLIFNAI